MPWHCGLFMVKTVVKSYLRSETFIRNPSSMWKRVIKRVFRTEGNHEIRRKEGEDGRTKK